MIHEAWSFSSQLEKHSVHQDACQIAQIILKFNVWSVLDLGSGIGILAQELHDRGVVVHQLEGAYEMLKVAHAEKRAGNSMVQGNVTHLPYLREAVSAAVLSFVLHHLGEHERRECLRECYRVLQLQGKMFIVDRVPRSRAILGLFPIYWDRVYKHQHAWTEPCPELRTLSMLRAELSLCGFSVEGSWVIREPLSKTFKSITMPKTVIVASRS